MANECNFFLYIYLSKLSILMDSRRVQTEGSFPRRDKYSVSNFPGSSKFTGVISKVLRASWKLANSLSDPVGSPVPKRKTPLSAKAIMQN